MALWSRSGLDELGPHVLAHVSVVALVSDGFTRVWQLGGCWLVVGVDSLSLNIQPASLAPSHGVRAPRPPVGKCFSSLILVTFATFPLTKIKPQGQAQRWYWESITKEYRFRDEAITEISPSYNFRLRKDQVMEPVT